MDKVNLALDLDGIDQDSTQWDGYERTHYGQLSLCLLSQFEFESHPS